MQKLLAPIRRRLNNGLYDICRGMHNSIPLTAINDLLHKEGLQMEDGFILTGKDSKASIDIFTTEGKEVNSVVALSWHKFDTGRWEINAYVS